MTRGDGRAGQCAGLLLTGGASRRHGTPKAELRIAGERLADRNARLLASVAGPVLEVGPGYSALDAVVEDVPGSGPLAAVAAGGAALAARHVGDRPVIVLAVDLPFVEVPLLHALVGAVETRDAIDVIDAVVPRVAGRSQPLCAWYSPSAMARAVELVAGGARAMQALLDAVTVHWFDESAWSTVATARCFADVDTPADARRFGLEPSG